MEQAVKEIRQFGDVFGVQADLTKQEAVPMAQRQILDRFGTVHILVNAADITGATSEFLELSDAD